MPLYPIPACVYQPTMAPGRRNASGYGRDRVPHAPEPPGRRAERADGHARPGRPVIAAPVPHPQPRAAVYTPQRRSDDVRTGRERAKEPSRARAPVYTPHRQDNARAGRERAREHSRTRRDRAREQSRSRRLEPAHRLYEPKRHADSRRPHSRRRPDERQRSRGPGCLDERQRSRGQGRPLSRTLWNPPRTHSTLDSRGRPQREVPRRYEAHRGGGGGGGGGASGADRHCVPERPRYADQRHDGYSRRAHARREGERRPARDFDVGSWIGTAYLPRGRFACREGARSRRDASMEVRFHRD